jgi:hypothetical protein
MTGTDRLGSEGHRPGFEILDTASPHPGFIDRNGRWWLRRCAECNLGLPAEPVEDGGCHTPDCPRRRKLTGKNQQ